MRKILSFLLLPYRKKKLFIKSSLFVGIIRLSLWIVPYRVLIKCLSKLSSSKSFNQSDDWKLIKEISHSVRICAEYVPFASCLTQALAVQTLLRLKGQKSTLKFGVDKEESGKLIAHAWVEIDDKIIIGGTSDINRYSVLTSNNAQFV
jgi:hypothetical protein